MTNRMSDIIPFRMNIGTGLSYFVGALGGIYLLFQGIQYIR